MSDTSSTPVKQRSFDVPTIFHGDRDETRESLAASDFTYFTSQPDVTSKDDSDEKQHVLDALSALEDVQEVRDTPGAKQRKKCRYSGSGVVRMKRNHRFSAQPEANLIEDAETNGRLLACRCFRDAYVSITVRGKLPPVKPPFRLRKRGIDMYLVKEEPINPAVLKENWAARSFSKGDSRFPISIDTAHKVLKELVLPSGGAAHGVIAIAGGTGSGKSQIARALIHSYLHEIVGSSRLQRHHPHLLTIEDPIEDFFQIVKESGPHPENSGEPDLVAELRKLCEKHGHEPGTPLFAPPYLTQATLGIDYTPREIGIDTPSLEEALTDALRQTPTVVFVGEIRDMPSIRQALEFAATGHLVVMTMHAGSLVESMDKLLNAYGAKTPNKRGEVAERVAAVIHLGRVPLSKDYQVNVPTVWARTPRTSAALVADGLSSILPHRMPVDDSALESDVPICLGRSAIVERLLQEAKREAEELRQKSDREADADALLNAIGEIEDELIAQALAGDLRGL